MLLGSVLWSIPAREQLLIPDKTEHPGDHLDCSIHKYILLESQVPLLDLFFQVLPFFRHERDAPEFPAVLPEGYPDKPGVGFLDVQRLIVHA
jgi:hypothetical protein